MRTAVQGHYASIVISALMAYSLSLAVFADAPDGIDSYGIGYTYEQPEDLLLIKRLRHAGVSLQRQETNDGMKKEWVNSLIAGFEMNLNT
ncbi:MAG: hypothetical protein COA42_13150, partial [Alteromonadaceae bacterium]